MGSSPLSCPGRPQERERLAAGFSALTFLKCLSGISEYHLCSRFLLLAPSDRGRGHAAACMQLWAGLLLWSCCQGPWQLRSQHYSAAEVLDCHLLGVRISSSSSSSSDQLKLSSKSSPCAAPVSSVLAASLSCLPLESDLLWGSSSLVQKPGLALQSVISTLVGTMLTKLFSILMT